MFLPEDIDEAHHIQPDTSVPDIGCGKIISIGWKGLKRIR